MKSEPPLRKLYPTKTYYFIAALIVLGFYGILASLFTFEARVLAFENEEPEYLADVTMLPIEKDPQIPWQRNLIASLDLLDPTVLSLPNARYGFSTVRNYEFERPLEDSQPLDLDFQYNIRPPLPELTKNPTIENLAEINLLEGRPTNLTQIPTYIEYQQYDPFAYWTKENGELMESIPPIPGKEFDQFNEEITISGPTYLSISVQPDFARVKIVKSCGDNEVDRLAENYLRRYLTKHLWAAQKESETKWSHANNTILLVHWRYLTKVKEADISTIEGVKNDWNRH